MRTRFSYIRPDSRVELLEILASSKGNVKVLAGGTDLLPNIRLGLENPSSVIDIKRIPGYSTIEYQKNAGLVIGPGVTITALSEDPGVRRRFGLLLACAEHLASRQIRNRATVAGNVVNASPCSDMAPALLCLNAQARISSVDGTRVVRFADFFTGVKKTVLTPREVLEAIIVPKAMANARSGYHKLKRIRGHDLGIVGVALLKTEEIVRVAVSSAAPVPVLLPDFPRDVSIDEVKDRVLEAISPIDDVRCSKDYREFMVGVYVERLMEDV